MMRLALHLAAIAVFTFPSAAEPPAGRPDLLRFANGDRLHGSYLGLGDRGPLWQHEGAEKAVEFSADQVRQVVLRAGRPLRPHDSLSHVALINGDRIPGRIVSLDQSAVTIDTSFAGELTVPRPRVAMFAPSPLGGRILYHGPFDERRWEMVAVDGPLPPEGGEAEEDLFRWNLSGAAWYWPHERGGTALIQRDAMADRSVLRFDLAWQSRLSFALAFHTDMEVPKPAGADEEDEKWGGRANFGPADVSSLARVFGTGYVMQLHQHHLILFRTGFDDKGQPTIDRLQPAAVNMPLGDVGRATVELRCNRGTGQIALLLNGEFVAQWSEGGGDGAGYAGRGDGFGFMVIGEKLPVRVSDVMLAEWNGMPDSARSLQVDDQDIVLLANGTDRFSGQVTALDAEGRLHLSGKYGDFRFPIADVAEVRFAKNSLEPKEESGSSVAVRLHPLGRISGRSLEGTRDSLRLLSPVAGELTLALDSAVTLEFQGSDSFLDDWDPQY